MYKEIEWLDFDLADTVEFMCSKDYKERFIAEYAQANCRYEKLFAIILSFHKGELGFVPKCPISILEGQASYMYNYIQILKERAMIEDIQLPQCN